MDTSKFDLCTLPLTPHEREQCYWLVSTAGNKQDQLRAGKALTKALTQIKMSDANNLSIHAMKIYYAHAVSEVFNNWKTQYFNLCSLDFVNKLNFEIQDTNDEQLWKICFNSFTNKLLLGELDTIIYPAYYKNIPDELLLARATEIVHPSSTPSVCKLPSFPLDVNKFSETDQDIINNWISEIQTIFDNKFKDA